MKTLTASASRIRWFVKLSCQIKNAYSEFSLGPKRKAAFDVLQGFFQRNIFRRSEDKMEMVGHNDELVQEEATPGAIVLQNIDQESSHFLGLENWASSFGHGRDEKRADFLWGVAHMPPGLKPGDFISSSTRPIRFAHPWLKP